MTIILTGGAGFIGTNFVNHWRSCSEERLVVVDKLTYAANPTVLKSKLDDLLEFEQGDIADSTFISDVLARHKPRAIINLAAETHVDRSINSPSVFVHTNVVGTYTLLEACKSYWLSLRKLEQASFRFVHVSTDEVFGSLASEAAPFVETNSYQPNGPYSATKAASDHLVRAWHRTYGLPVITTNCSNNYGPYQYPEKLIPLTVMNALSGKQISVYGDGKQIRDWLFVDDHCIALACILERGRVGGTYNIGSRCEITNLELVNTICEILDELRPRADRSSYRNQICFVTDRLGHDRRYAIDSTKIEMELGWKAEESFNAGIRKTIGWYLDETPTQL